MDKQPAEVTAAPGAPETAPPPPPAKRRLSRPSLLLVALASIALLAFAGWSLLTRSTPRDFYLQDAAPEQRIQLVESLERQLAEGTVEAGDRRVLEAVIDIQRHTLAKGHFPKSVRDLPLDSGFIDDGFRVVGSRAQWRLYGPGQELLARGN